MPQGVKMYPKLTLIQSKSIYVWAPFSLPGLVWSPNQSQDQFWLHFSLKFDDFPMTFGPNLTNSACFHGRFSMMISTTPPTFTAEITSRLRSDFCRYLNPTPWLMHSTLPAQSIWNVTHLGNLFPYMDLFGLRINSFVILGCLVSLDVTLPPPSLSQCIARLVSQGEAGASAIVATF